MFFFIEAEAAFVVSFDTKWYWSSWFVFKEQQNAKELNVPSLQDEYTSIQLTD